MTRTPFPERTVRVKNFNDIKLAVKQEQDLENYLLQSINPFWQLQSKRVLQFLINFL